MTTQWPTVKLGEVVTPVKRAETPRPGISYRQIGVRLWGEGAYERETMDGSQTKYSQLFRAETGDIVVNKIWARNGSIAVVPESLAGCFGSAEFPMFAPKRDRLAPNWIRWLTKTPKFWAQCDDKSRGTSGKNRIKPEQFLSVEIPLPSIEDQQRLVTRIEKLSVQIREACTLRYQATEEVEAMLVSYAATLLTHANEHFPSELLVDVCDFEGGSQPPKSMFRYEPTPGYVRFLQIRDFSCDDHQTYIPDSPRNSTVEPHEVLVGRYGASLGKILRGKRGAYNVAMCKAVPKTSDLDLDFLAMSLRYGAFQERLSEISRSAQAGFNKTDIKHVNLAIPPRGEQRRIVSKLNNLQADVNALKQLQRETAVELEAMLPSVLSKAFEGEL
jgi:type I restriction enzyme S subunit